MAFNLKCRREVRSGKPKTFHPEPPNHQTAITTRTFFFPIWDAILGAAGFYWVDKAIGLEELLMGVTQGDA